MQFQCQLVALFAEGDLPAHARSESDLPLAFGDLRRQRLGRVVGDVEHRLDELFAVATKLRNGRVVIAPHLQPARKLGQDQRTHPLAHFVDVDVAHHVRAAVRRQKPVHQ